MRIYHLIDTADWERAQATGRHAPCSLARHGFLHCCRASQIGFVAARHFGGRTDLLVLEIDPARAGAPLRYEASEPGQDSFPHLFGPLPTGAVTGVWPLGGWNGGCGAAEPP